MQANCPQTGQSSSRQAEEQAGQLTYGRHRAAIRKHHHHAPGIKVRLHAATHHIHDQPMPLLLLLLSLLWLRWHPIGSASGSSCPLRHATCIRCTLLAAAITARLLLPLLLPLRRRGAAVAGQRGGP
jgi:hypothetical protein